MRSHARIGYDILRKSDAPVFQLAAEIALSHHEKWDGSGYPNGLAGLDIPESGWLVAVADVFDALTMKRAYRDAWPLDRVLATLKEAPAFTSTPRCSTPSSASCRRSSTYRRNGTPVRRRQTALRAYHDRLFEAEMHQGTNEVLRWFPTNCS